jgi:hypothetical protein
MVQLRLHVQNGDLQADEIGLGAEVQRSTGVGHWQPVGSSFSKNALLGCRMRCAPTSAQPRALRTHPVIREQSSSFERITVETGAKKMCSRDLLE